jgi:hypothetical protein
LLVNAVPVLLIVARRLSADVVNPHAAKPGVMLTSPVLGRYRRVTADAGVASAISKRMDKSRRFIAVSPNRPTT